MTKYKQIFLVGCLCFFFFILSITSVFFPIKKSITYDEHYHYETGLAILSGKPSERGVTDKDAERGLTELHVRNNVPVSVLNVLMSRAFPEQIISKLTEKKYLLYDGKIYPDGKIYVGKLATIFASVILAIYVFLWARQLYGIPAGFLALCLYILDPNIIAHSALVTQDIFSACAVFIAIYYFWKFLKFGGRKNAVLSIITFAIAQVTRYSSIYLVAIYLVLVLGFYGSTIFNLLQTKNFTKLISSIKKFVYYTTLFALITILIINISFSFEKTFTKFGDYKFASQFFTSLQSNNFPLLRQIPVPVPVAYLQGVDFGKYKQETGFGSGASYLMGKLGIENGRLKGFKEYYLIAFLYKVPIATQLILLMAIISLIRYRNNIDFWQNEAFLIIPSLIFPIAFSLSIAQLGIRYLLMIFPLLFVFSSRVVIGWQALKNKYQIFIISLITYLLISNLSYFPHYIPYFNELLTDRKMGYTILADSNLDWGQNWIYLEKYLEENPDAAYIEYLDKTRIILITSKGKEEINPAQFQGGLVVVGANQLVGVINDPKMFQWLREYKKPVDNIGYNFLVFKTQPQDLIIKE